MVGFLTSRLGGWAVGGLVCAIVFGLWQWERAKSAKLRGQVDGLKVSLATETSRADAEARNAQRLAALTEKSIDLSRGLNERLDASRLTTAKHVAENEALKAKELQNAIKEPIQRGNAAADRIHNSLCRAWGSKSGTCADADRPSGFSPDHKE